MTLPTAEDEVTEADIDQANPEQFARMMEELYGTRETWALPLERLMAGEESAVAEFKTSARWDTDGQVTKKAPAVVTQPTARLAQPQGETLCACAG